MKGVESVKAVAIGIFIKCFIDSIILTQKK